MQLWCYFCGTERARRELNHWCFDNKKYSLNYQVSLAATAGPAGGKENSQAGEGRDGAQVISAAQMLRTEKKAIIRRKTHIMMTVTTDLESKNSQKYLNKRGVVLV